MSATEPTSAPLFAQDGGLEDARCPPRHPAGMAWELSSEQARMVREQPLLRKMWERGV